MTAPLIALFELGLIGLSPVGAVLGLRHRDAARWSRELVGYRLQIPGDLDLVGLETFLAGLSGLLAGRWQRLITVRGIGFEIVATTAGIRHYLLVPRSRAETVLALLRGALPSLGVNLDADYDLSEPTLAGALRLNRRHLPLRMDRPEPIGRAILATLQPLEADETVVVQWLLSPVGYTQPPDSDGHDTIWRQLVGGRPTTASPSKPVRDKYASPLFVTAGRLGVTSASRARDRQLLARVTAAFHAANSEHAHLQRRWRPNRQITRALVRRRLSVGGGSDRLNSRELVGLLALPAGGLSLPGLQLGGTRQLAPSSNIPRLGRIVADATFPGLVRPLALSVVASLMHQHIIGPSGVGKSTLLLSLYAQDAAAGRGIVLIDPKMDLAEAALDVTPAERDVIVLDPTDDRPVGLNLFAGGIEDPELVAEQVLSVMHRLYEASWGARTDDILRHALLSLVRLPGTSFAELPLLLTDPGFRKSIVSQIDDPISLSPFWSWYEALSETERLTMIAPILNKLRAVVARPRLRRVLGQADSLIDFDDILASGKILIVPLAAGTLGEDAAALLGSFVLAKLWQAIQRRIRLNPAERTPVMVFVDEFQTVTNLASPLPEVLAQARAMGVGFTLAHQHLGQLDRQIQAAVLANCRSRVIFQLSAGDARAFAPQVAPHLGAQDLQGLGAYEVVATLATDGAVSAPVTGRTRPAPTPLGHGEHLRERSRQRYGRDAADLDAALRRRQEELVGSGVVGRQRRAQ